VRRIGRLIAGVVAVAAAVALYAFVLTRGGKFW
jgi:hypothetical protein